MAGVNQTITKRVPAKTSEKMEPKSPLKTTPAAGKGCRTSSKASSSSKGAPKRNFSRVLGAWLEEFNKTKGVETQFYGENWKTQDRWCRRQEEDCEAWMNNELTDEKDIRHID